jgi:acetyl-CoA carboxylase biotin carboxyl carrier protein
MDLTNEDVADVLAVLDSLPYDELDLQTPRFRLILRRTPDGWTQSVEARSEPSKLEVGPPDPEVTTSLPQRRVPDDVVATTTRLEAEAEEAPKANGAVEAPSEAAEAPSGIADRARADAGEGRELVAVQAPLPGTFYRAPRPGAAPFVEVGSRVGADTVVGIVETMKLMNSVTAGVDGEVAEICLGNAEFAALGATLLRIRAD